MILRVEVGSYLRKYVSGYDPEKGLELELDAEKTAGQIIDELGIPRNETAVIMVNRKAAQLDHALKDGDLLGLFPVALGG
jgi:sulfur carrier protein ThiS